MSVTTSSRATPAAATTTTSTPALTWSRDGDRHVCTDPAGVRVGWYQRVGSWWATFTPDRNSGWSEQFLDTEAEARQRVERRWAS